MMVFGSLKTTFRKSFFVPGKRTPETYIVEFLDTKQVTVVQPFISVLPRVIELLFKT